MTEINCAYSLIAYYRSAARTRLECFVNKRDTDTKEFELVQFAGASDMPNAKDERHSHGPISTTFGANVVASTRFV